MNELVQVQTHLEDVERAREHFATRNWSADDREHMNIAILAVDERARRLEREEVHLINTAAGLTHFCEEIAAVPALPVRGAFQSGGMLVLFGKDLSDQRSEAEREYLREHLFSYRGFVEGESDGVWALGTVGPTHATITAEDAHRHVCEAWRSANEVMPSCADEMQDASVLIQRHLADLVEALEDTPIRNDVEGL